MSSTPSPQDDDEWRVAETPGGWEDEQRPVRRAPRRAKRAQRASFLSDPAVRPLLAVGGLAVVGMCALGCFAVLLLLLGGAGDRIGEIFRPSEARVTPQPTAPISETLRNIVSVNGTAVPPSIPSRLNVGSRSFEILPLSISDDRKWTYDVNNKRAAYWAVGTLVNYVIGLHSSTENRELYESIQLNDLLSLDSSNGTQRYRVVQKTKVQASDVALVADPTAPRMTLVMLGQSGEERDVVIAQYTDEGTPNQPVSLGAPVNLGDGRVVALNARLVPGGSAGLIEGKNYYQVNIRVTNVVTRILDAAQFYTELSDGQGNRYQLAPAGASAAGAYGWAAGALQPGASLTATAAFEVPSSMAGPYLEWRFALDPANPYVAKVAIAYQPIFVDPTPVATAQPRVRVDIAAANISPDGTELNVIGNLTNLTGEPLTVSLKDTQLKGADGLLTPLNSSSLPGLPWEVNPNGTLTFKLTFAKPAQLPATFTLLDQSVQIAPN